MLPPAPSSSRSPATPAATSIAITPPASTPETVSTPPISTSTAQAPRQPPSAFADPYRIQDEGQQTDTWSDQKAVERHILLIRSRTVTQPVTLLKRDAHVTWLLDSLQSLPYGFEAFAAQQPWVCFWTIHTLNLLRVSLDPQVADALVDHIESFRDPVHGGYGGGPDQSAHMASSFAAVMALASIGTRRALSSIDVPGMTRFLVAMKIPDGAFKVSEGGESDVRALYCALAIASLLNIPLQADEASAQEGIDESPAPPDLADGVPDFLKSLQAFDGGLGGTPGAEAHGGNTYCGVAAALLADALPSLDVEAVLDWAVMRQMGFEGGFQGRCNKLVDSCYSFWVGSLFPLLAMRRSADSPPDVSDMFDAEALQRYILECCQGESGGLRDKPGAGRDLMHTCYALSGLSIAQHYGGATVHAETNAVERTNVVFNLRQDKFENAWAFFRTQP